MVAVSFWLKLTICGQRGFRNTIVLPGSSITDVDVNRHVTFSPANIPRVIHCLKVDAVLTYSPFTLEVETLLRCIIIFWWVTSWSLKIQEACLALIPPGTLYIYLYISIYIYLYISIYIYLYIYIYIYLYIYIYISIYKCIKFHCPWNPPYKKGSRMVLKAGARCQQKLVGFSSPPTAAAAATLVRLLQSVLRGRLAGPGLG